MRCSHTSKRIRAHPLGMSREWTATKVSGALPVRLQHCITHAHACGTMRSVTFSQSVTTTHGGVMPAFAEALCSKSARLRQHCIAPPWP